MHLLFFFFVLSLGQAHAMIVPQEAVEAELKAADLVADIKVSTLQCFMDPEYYATYKVDAVITAIQSSQLSEETTPAVGDNIVIRGLGGEWKDKGVSFSGHPRPYAGERYRAYLKRNSQNTYSLTGYDAGLVKLSPSRKHSRNRTDGSNGQGNGAYLHWDEKFFPIPYYISSSSFQGLQDYVSAIDASFKTWRDVSDIKVDFLPMGCSLGAKNENDGLNHVILVNENWPFNDPQVIAITRNFYVAGEGNTAGLILDSDILLNGVNHQFTTTNEPGKNDVQNIVTHEVGHFLGLGHEITPTDSDAVMFANAVPNEIKKRVLKSSDLDGIREGYLGFNNKLTWTGSPCNVTGATCLAIHQRQTSHPILLFLGGLFLFITVLIGRIVTPKIPR